MRNISSAIERRRNRNDAAAIPRERSRTWRYLAWSPLSEQPASKATRPRRLDGVARVFAMATTGEVNDGILVADAAKSAGVEHLVYSSVGGAERHSGIPHFESKRRVEEHIEKSWNTSHIRAADVFL